MRLMRKPLILCVAVIAAVGGCSDDPTGPAVGEFMATMTGAVSERFEGNVFTTRVFSEEWPQGRYTISMIDPGDGNNELLLIECPDPTVLQIRTYTLGATDQVCHGVYRRIRTFDFGVLDEAISHEGTLTVTGLSRESMAGTFNFTGPLRTGTQQAGNVTVTGTFVAIRNQ